MYKYSKFNYYLFENERIIIYNFLSSKMLCVFKSKDIIIFQYLLQLYSEGTADTVPCNELIESGIVVLSTVKEIELLDNAYENFIDNDTFHITILVNERCNFKCVYCYEENAGIEITNDIIDGIIFFVCDMIKKHNYHHLHISWFGGEPLLSMPSISSVMYKIKNELKNIEITSSMTTNGYLLYGTTLSTLLTLGINSFQITLDGNMESHNATRRLKDGSKTFNKIWENIITLCEYDEPFELLIRANYNETNYDNIYKLIDMVKDLNDNRIKMHFHPIINMPGSGINSDTCEYCDDYFSDIVITEYTRYCLRNNIVTDSWGMKAVPFCGNCYAANPNYFAIDPSGVLRKCTVSIKESYNDVGRILGPDKYYINDEKNQKWVNNYSMESEQCKACEMLPLCYGPGCPEGVLRNGVRRCRKNTYFFDQILTEITK